MIDAVNYDIDGLRFERATPYDLGTYFDEIQDLRSRFYEKVFRQRSPEEVAHFVGRLTYATWLEPNGSVGKTAKEGQRRAQASVLAAFDDKTNDIVGYMYSAENVSSKVENSMAKMHMPKVLRTPVGNFERSFKLNRGNYYVWASEYVHDPERTGLSPILGSLSLEGYDPNLFGTWYPWKEESVLRRHLTDWGYRWDGGRPDDVNGFGANARPAQQERWVVPVSLALDRIGQLPGAAFVLEQARATMPQISRFNPWDE